MGVTSFRVTEYSIECDDCNKLEVCHSTLEDVHSKQQAIKWAEMHVLKNGHILCDACYKKKTGKSISFARLCCFAGYRSNFSPVT